MSPSRPSARGFTLVELIISIAIFGVLVSAALAFMARENTGFQESVRRLSALRNARYAATALEQDLRTVGINVASGQPELVYADGDVVAFTADYATNLPNDPFAVFRDRDAPMRQVTLPRTAVTIPGTTFGFPSITYDPRPNVPSPAELLIFYFKEDDTTTRTDDYVLWRKVNHGTPERVARNLLHTDTDPFFVFGVRSAGASGISAVPQGQLPMSHSVDLHLSAADTGSAASIDGIRAVRVNFSATNGRSGADEVIVQMSRFIDLPNTGYQDLSTCGDDPLLGVSPTVALIAGPIDQSIQIRWTPAIDETGGEKDVVRYVIWRRVGAGIDWGNAYVGLPAGEASYLYEDQDIQAGETYQYALAAQDCTPTLSRLVASGAITVPIAP